MKKQRILFLSLVLACALALGGCGANFDGWGGDPDVNLGPYPSGSGEDEGDGTGGSEAPGSEGFVHDKIIEQGFFETAEAPASYFSLDRNTAGYSQVRAQINLGSAVVPDSVRIEEMINYFSYDYPAPEEGEVVKATTYLSDCPWEETHKLLTVGIKTEEKVLQDVRNNYVFLIDTSGSMSARVRGLENSMTCLDLVKYGVGKAVEGLHDGDSVAIATYAGHAGQFLEPTLATEQGKKDILKKVDTLSAYGSTNGSGGLEVAYDLAERYFSEGGNNRVILLSDGDFNVGLQSQEKLTEFIQEKAKSGVYLSVIGVGIGNMRDDFMQTLALNGNGNYAYIDTPAEAQKVMGSELGGMLFTVAKDAKAGITFDEKAVTKYRLIGYDMKTMSESDFNNTEKDAGELGSNLCVTALYEVELAEGLEEGSDLAEVEIRFKLPESGEDRSVKAAAVNTGNGTEDTQFIACVAEFGLVLRGSKYAPHASLDAVLSRLRDLPDYLENDIYKSEFLALAVKAHAMTE